MHGSYKTEAAVVCSLRLGEADRVLHLYTPSRGRVGAVAKGVRRSARASEGGSSRSATSRSRCTRAAASCTRSAASTRLRPTTTSVSSPGVRASPACAARRSCACSRREIRRRACSPPSAACSTCSTATRRPRGTSRSTRSRWPSSSSCTAWPGSPPACGLRGLRRRGRAAGALLAGRRRRRLQRLPGRHPVAAGRARGPLVPAQGSSCGGAPLMPGVAATVARCASDLNAEHGGFRLRSLALTAGR